MTSYTPFTADAVYLGEFYRWPPLTPHKPIPAAHQLAGDTAVTADPSPAGGGGSYHARADSYAASAKAMAGRPGVAKMRVRASDARHLALAHELGLLDG